ncbi:MAG: hypothetical protein Q7V58_10140 [Actinomycetota bacterium]|nr:hypothetical protein [Actinomycetota bacterium]
MLAACGAASPSSPAESTPCGWDLSNAAGRQANSEYLTETMQWLAENPGQAPPAPTHAAWQGDCPSGPPVPPPDEEHDDPD